MRKFNITEDVTVELSRGKSIRAYETYLKVEKSAEEASNNFFQAIEDVQLGNDGYDRSDLYDWEAEWHRLEVKAWEAWEAFVA